MCAFHSRAGNQCVRPQMCDDAVLANTAESNAVLGERKPEANALLECDLAGNLSAHTTGCCYVAQMCSASARVGAC